MKAFLDVGEEECMTRERWGASKFVRNQWRSITDNSYAHDADPDTIPADDLPEDFSQHSFITLEDFIPIVQPAFGTGRNAMSLPNIKALFKRAHFIVNTSKYTYIKEAKVDNVKVFAHITSYLTPEAGALLLAVKENRDALPLPHTMRNHIGEEQRIFAELVQTADEPRNVRRRVAPAQPVLAIPVPESEDANGVRIWL